MNVQLKKLQDKYQTVENIKTNGIDTELDFEIESKELTSWRDSKSVVALSAFIKANSEHGFMLVELDGKVTLHFEPGLTPKEERRWQLALEVMDLIEAAIDDFNFLIAHGLITLPKHCGFNK